MAGALVMMASSGCAIGGLPPPLLPEPIAYADTLPIAEPAARELIESVPPYVAIVGSGTSAVSVRRWTGARREAMNLTRLDDVVGSAWFEHRIGRRHLTPAEVARGPTTLGPDTARSLRVVARSEGRTPGFTVEDARGDRYLLKFDPPLYPHLATAADVITSRLLYAAGYHTPENYAVAVAPERLVLGDEAVVTQEELDGVLAGVARLPDGRLVAMASKFLPGVPKGPFRFEGRRRDDPNDHYHHEYRRELRGLFVLAAWLNHVELRFANTLDTYVEGGYLRHHLIDFGESLGSGTLGPLDARAGRESNFDLEPVLARFVTLGFIRPTWTLGDSTAVHPSIGRLPDEEYDPGGWRPRWSNDAFSNLTVRDGYWGARLVAAFTDDHVRAAVAEGGITDPEAREILADILIRRRDRTVAHWYARVSPVEDALSRPAADGSGLEISFEDLAIRDAISPAASTRYRFRFEHAALGLDVGGESSASRGPRQTLRIEARPADDGRRLTSAERIATLEIRALRDGAAGRPATVYLSLEPETRTYRVVGLRH